MDNGHLLEYSHLIDGRDLAASSSYEVSNPILWAQPCDCLSLTFQRPHLQVSYWVWASEHRFSGHKYLAPRGPTMGLSLLLHGGGPW